jgi:hypothetical protein
MSVDSMASIQGLLNQNGSMSQGNAVSQLLQQVAAKQTGTNANGFSSELLSQLNSSTSANGVQGASGDFANNMALLGSLNSPSAQMMAMKAQGMTSTQIASNIISKLDTTGTGTLNQTDSGLSPQAFSQIDTDGDGKISQTELATALRKSEHGHGHRHHGGSGKDDDSNGLLSQITSSGLPQQMMSQLDTNGDGKVSPDELKAGLNNFKQALSSFKGVQADASSASGQGLLSQLNSNNMNYYIAAYGNGSQAA